MKFDKIKKGFLIKNEHFYADNLTSNCTNLKFIIYHRNVMFRNM